MPTGDDDAELADDDVTPVSGAPLDELDDPDPVDVLSPPSSVSNATVPTTISRTTAQASRMRRVVWDIDRAGAG
jgi:hypothetical protein